MYTILVVTVERADNNHYENLKMEEGVKEVDEAYETADKFMEKFQVVFIALMFLWVILVLVWYKWLGFSK